MSYQTLTPWGPALEREPSLASISRDTKRQLASLNKEPVRFYYPWHGGWLGPIRVINGTTEFYLKRKQANEYQKSVVALGGTIEVIRT